MGTRWELEPDPEALGHLLDAVTRRLVTYVEELPDRPAYDPVADPVALAASVAEPLPEHGVELEPLLDRLFGTLIPAGVNPAGPGSLSYVNGGGLVHGAVAGLVAAMTNRFGGFWSAAPGVNAIESTVVRWICDLVGLPAGSGGLLLTGGSMANLTAIVTARSERLSAPLSHATVYTSDQVHHSVQKAALVAGVPLGNVRVISTDERFRVRVDALEEALLADRAQGLAPFCVVGTAGSTGTGSIDDLHALADLCARHRTWFHVDAAYGGFFRLTERGRTALSGLERADSVTLDPHKSLFLPFGTGALVVRDEQALVRAHQLHSGCVVGIAAEADTCGEVNFADLSVEQTREARGLKVWLPLKLVGAAAFRDALDEKLDLAAWAADRLREVPGLELVSAPELSTFAFRMVGPDDATSDALNRRLVELVNRSGEVHLATAVVRDRVVVRLCIVSFRTHRPTVEIGVERVRSAVQHLSSLPGSPS